MTDKNDYFDSSSLILFLYKYKNILGLIIVISIVTSAIISCVIPEQYKSTVVLYPSNTNSIAKALINSGNNSNNDIMEFGEEEKTEQLLELLNSEMVTNTILKEFNLKEHYEIQDSKTPITDLLKKFKKNISYSRNVNMAVEIEVYDINPDTASKIANRIVQVADNVLNQIQKERTRQGFEIVKKTYNQKRQEIQNMEDSLAMLMKLGVLDIRSQTEVYSDAHAQAIAKGNTSAIQALEKKIKTLSEHGSRFLSLKENLENERLQLCELKAKYNEAKIDAEERIKNFFVVTNAFPAEKKSYPIRSLIVILATIGSLIMGILALIVFEQLQRLKYSVENK